MIMYAVTQVEVKVRVHGQCADHDIKSSWLNLISMPLVLSASRAWVLPMRCSANDALVKRCHEEATWPHLLAMPLALSASRVLCVTDII